MLKFLSRHAIIVVGASAALFTMALWLTLVTRLGMAVEQAALIAGLTLLSLAQLHVYLDRSRGRKTLEREIERIMVATHDLIGDVAGLRGDLDDMRKRIGEKNYLHADRIAAQVASLEAMVARMAEEDERRGAFEDRLASQAEALARTALAVREARNAAPAGSAAAAKATPAAGPAPARPPRELVDRVTAAVAEARADIHIQPVVTLPQRKIRYYEALMRLRDAEGHTIMPQEFLSVAAGDGLGAEIDNLLLFRSIALVRRLGERRNGVAVFCNISPFTLLDADFFPQFVEFMEANREVAPQLVLEMAQDRLDEFGALEEESIRALADLGFRFSLDHVVRLDLDFARLADLGFRFVKIEAGTILDAGRAQDARVHPEDMAKLAARHGIELIVEKIETESAVVNLLDFDVRLGQGYLFARPRPVRGDALAPATRAAA